MYDTDKSRMLDKSEIRRLIKMIYGDRFADNARLRRVIEVLDLDGDGDVQQDEWVLMCKQYPMLLWPAHTQQQARARAPSVGVGVGVSHAGAASGVCARACGRETRELIRAAVARAVAVRGPAAACARASAAWGTACT